MKYLKVDLTIYSALNPMIRQSHKWAEPFWLPVFESDSNLEARSDLDLRKRPSSLP